MRNLVGNCGCATVVAKTNIAGIAHTRARARNSRGANRVSCVSMRARARKRLERHQLLTHNHTHTHTAHSQTQTQSTQHVRCARVVRAVYQCLRVCVCVFDERVHACCEIEYARYLFGGVRAVRAEKLQTIRRQHTIALAGSWHACDSQTRLRAPRVCVCSRIPKCAHAHNQVSIPGASFNCFWCTINRARETPCGCLAINWTNYCTPSTRGAMRLARYAPQLIRCNVAAFFGTVDKMMANGDVYVLRPVCFSSCDDIFEHNAQQAKAQSILISAVCSQSTARCSTDSHATYARYKISNRRYSVCLLYSIDKTTCACKLIQLKVAYVLMCQWMLKTLSSLVV